MTTRHLLIMMTALIAAPVVTSAQQTDAALLAESRALTDELGRRLLAALTETLGSSGAVTAIAVCKDLAPQIASDIARRSGAKIGRTSARLRNPGNVAEAWQAEVLDAFAAALGRGESAADLEYFARVDGSAHYMRPIVAGGICLDCHGMQIGDDVAAALDEHYPHDRATGYASGELRGAFVVVWPDTAGD